jgi:hypothetical protein
MQLPTKKGKPKAKKTRTVEVPMEYLNALRRAAGRLIDPETAEITWHDVWLADPYDDQPDVPATCNIVGDDFFTRVPGTNVWIVSSDLPKPTFDRIWEHRWLHRRRLDMSFSLPV